MNKRFIDVILVPCLITFIGGLGFMVWGAWYTGVELHSPFSRHWLATVFGAPIPAWMALLMLAAAALLGWKSHLSRQRYDVAYQQASDAQKKLEPSERNHDLHIFERSNALMDEEALTELLDSLQTDDSYFLSQTERVRKFTHFFSQTSNQYINPELRSSESEILTHLDALTSFIGRSFFVYPNNQTYRNDTRLCMYPDLNIDRGGTGNPASMTKYNQCQAELDTLSSAVRKAYLSYRLKVKHQLAV